MNCRHEVAYGATAALALMPTIRTAESWIHYYKRLVEVSDKAATAPCLPPPPSLSGSHSRLIWLVPTMEAPSTLKPAEVALAMVNHGVAKHAERWDRTFFKAVSASRRAHLWMARLSSWY